MNIQSVLLAVVQHEDVKATMRALVDAGFKVTRISSMGGFLRVGNATLLLGVARRDVPLALKLLTENCYQRTIFVSPEPVVPAMGVPPFVAPVEVEIGGATVFVLPIEQFIRIDVQRQSVTFEPRERKRETMDMKLIMAIVPEEMANGILDSLIEAQHRATLISTTGGLLHKGNATLLIGVEANKVDEAIRQIERICLDILSKGNNVDATANIFVLDVEQYKSIGMEPVPSTAVETNPLPSRT